MTDQSSDAPRAEPIGPGMEVVMVPIDELVLDNRNARKGDVAAIVDSLREFGQHRAVVVQRGTNKIIAGNHLVKAARIIGWTDVAVTFVDDDDKTAIRRAIADNAVGDRGRWDDDILRELLGEVGTAPLPGFDDKQVDKLLAEVTRASSTSAPAPEYPIVARMGEKYDYVLVVATHEIDCTWLESRFGLRKEKSYKSNTVGKSRVVTVDRLRREWGELDEPEAALPVSEPSATVAEPEGAGEEHAPVG